MASRRRLIIPGTPVHITQRGVDRGPTFLTEEDFAVYLWALRSASHAANCGVHAYVLMTNHVHLLLTPADATSPSHLMSMLGRRYVRYFNQRYQRTGTLWEGRYRSTIVGSDDYFFACCRYIEQNPQRAHLVDRCEDYPWSSFRRNACGDPDSVVTSHPLYTALATDDAARRDAYRGIFTRELSSPVVTDIHTAPLLRPALQVSPYRQLVAELPGTTGRALGSSPRNDPV